jgi:hypothetical protein
MIVYDHLLALTDDTGIYQHAKGKIPWREHGYCSDDVCRALQVVVRSGVDTPEMRRAARTYVSFLMHAENPPHGYRNFMGFDRRWLEDVGSTDSRARTAYALAETAADDPFGELAYPARHSYELMLDLMEWWDSPRSAAYLALSVVRDVSTKDPTAPALRDRLLYFLQESRTSEWPWFERYLTYSNALLPHALLCLNATEEALETLEWLWNHEAPRDIVEPTGNQGFAEPGRKAKWDQQPIELAELSAACRAAFERTGEEKWRARQTLCADWFRGKNVLSVPMFDASGAGFDGLSEHGPSLNAGAESTIAYLLTMQDEEALRHIPTPS